MTLHTNLLGSNNDTASKQYTSKLTSNVSTGETVSPLQSPDFLCIYLIWSFTEFGSMYAAGKMMSP